LLECGPGGEWRLAAFDALPEGGPERGALLRRERLYHSHIEYWRKQQEAGTLQASAGKPARDAESRSE
jgi:transposase